MSAVTNRGELPSALEQWDELRVRLQSHPIALFLDYDGTLAPIAARPELAILPEAMRDVLRTLGRRVPVAIVTGRALSDVRGLVALDGLYYAGNHGFEIEGPGVSHRPAPGLRQEFDDLAAGLEPLVQATDGSTMEAKGYSVAIHYRGVEAHGVAELRDAVHEAAADNPDVRVGHGKKVFELRPTLAWHKGKAVRWLLDALAGDGPAPTPVFLGDDRTDEDAFAEIRDDGIGIFVGQPAWGTAARYRVQGPAEVLTLLRRLSEFTPEE